MLRPQPDLFRQLEDGSMNRPEFTAENAVMQRNRDGMKPKTTAAVALALATAAACMSDAAAQSTVVGVVDYGVDSTHPWLRGRVDYPRGYDAELNQRQGMDHGTMVASIILQKTRHVRVESITWDFSAYTDFFRARDQCVIGDQRGCDRALKHVVGHLYEHAMLWQLFPVVNSSHGIDINLAEDLSRLRAAIPLRMIDHLRVAEAELWDLYTQARQPPHRRAIHVRANGNQRQEDGTRAWDLHGAMTYLYPDLWGHTLFVTAIDPATERIADYANFCQPVPPGWDSQRHGRHYCVAAPGRHVVALPGGGQKVEEGTSLAAPYVAGILGEMHVRCRGLAGSELLRLLLETADRRPPYHDEFKYGAGVVTYERALSACG